MKLVDWILHRAAVSQCARIDLFLTAYCQWWREGGARWCSGTEWPLAEAAL